MATFSIRIVQQITEQGSGDFFIEATNAEAAAGILLRARLGTCYGESEAPSGVARRGFPSTAAQRPYGS